MGCCLSTTTDPKSRNPDDASPPQPPPVLEEETVKEVLTETPIISKPHTSTPTTLSQTKSNKHPIIQEPDPTPKPELSTKPPADTFSDASELCSYTESYSTTLTALTEKRDENDEDDGEVTQRVVNRTSPAPKLPRKRYSAPAAGEHLRNKERGIRSPARGSLPSPEKKAQVASRSVPSRSVTAQQRRNVGPPPNVMRRNNTADGPRPRSRSPATRGEVGVVPRRNVRNPIPNPTSADRPVGQTPAPASKVENAEGKLDMPEKQDVAVTPEPRESLDNPLVSLECFIFL